jgi:hypothetical protein
MYTGMTSGCIVNKGGTKSVNPSHPTRRAALGVLSDRRLRGESEASSMLERPYRKPWDTILRGLLS